MMRTKFWERNDQQGACANVQHNKLRHSYAFLDGEDIHVRLHAVLKEAKLPLGAEHRWYKQKRIV